MQQLKNEITQSRETLGRDLLILGHHYQHDDVIRHTDFSGDSLELARQAAKATAKNIVFCGVHFMGESAAALASAHQKIFLPAPDADCIMAKMVPFTLLDKVMQRLTANGRKIIPLTYVNSPLGVKAVCGKYGGSVCTSSNADKMLSWAMSQGDGVLFVPDKNLGRNTAHNLGLPESKQCVLNIQQDGSLLDSKEQKNAIANSDLLLWPGCCAIHAIRFKVKQIEELRNKIPGIQVIVHPECTPEVVLAADFSGSTSALIKYVATAPKGSNIAVGTEINLVKRLQNQYAGEKNIFPLAVSDCANMAKVTEEKLAAVLKNIIAGKAQPMEINAEQAVNARAALSTMLNVCA